MDIRRQNLHQDYKNQQNFSLYQATNLITKSTLSDTNSAKSSSLTTGKASQATPFSYNPQSGIISKDQKILKWKMASLKTEEVLKVT